MLDTASPIQGSVIAMMLLWFATFYVALQINFIKTGTSEILDFDTHAAKTVENYVVAADFDHKQVAQLPLRSKGPKSLDEDDVESLSQEEIASRIVVGESHRKNPEFHYEDVAPYEIAPPQSAAALVSTDVAVSQKSVLAVGFIAFLLLLTTIQGNMMTVAGLKKPNPSLLGGVTQALGRRKRAVQSDGYRSM